MIFVTVGTTLPFDELLREVDRLAETYFSSEQVICQTGNSQYLPKHCEHFAWKPELHTLFSEASLIITHGGTGSTLQALRSGKPFVAMANPRGEGDHQAEFLTDLSKEIDFVWGRDCRELEKLCAKAYACGPSRLESLNDGQDLAAEILRLTREQA